MSEKSGPTLEEYRELPHRKRADSFERQLASATIRFEDSIRITSVDLFESEVKFIPIQLAVSPADEVLDQAIYSRGLAAQRTILSVTLTALTSRDNTQLDNCLKQVEALVTGNGGLIINQSEHSTRELVTKIVRAVFRGRDAPRSTSGPREIYLTIHF